MNEMFECPICFARHEQNRLNCSCGFSGSGYTRYFIGETESDCREQLFEIYKYTKKVYYGQIAYPYRDFFYTDLPDYVLVTDASRERGLAVVNADANEATRDRYVRADEGLLAFGSQVKSLILNVDEIDSRMLDESCLKILFLGKRVKSLGSGGLMHQALRYLFVDSENPYLTAENHVLYDKQQTTLICYPTRKPEEEYTVPESVRHIAPRAFGYGPDHLRRIRLPRALRNHDAIRAFFAPHTEVQFY